MKRLRIALVAPSGTFAVDKLERATERAHELGFDLVSATKVRDTTPQFLNGSRHERLQELEQAEAHNADAIWCVRGGCGAVELWHDYHDAIYRNQHAPLIGYSDITIYHFLRLYRAHRIGIHGPVFLDLSEGDVSHIEAMGLLLRGEAHKLIYPALTNLNHSIAQSLTGELVPMNLASLQSILGCFDADFFRGKILAIEDVNEPHYKVFRIMHHLKNSRILAGLKALVIGYFGPDRQQIIDETLLPLAQAEGLPLFDWPIFGHERPNWPLLFGAHVTISKIDTSFSTLSYHEHFDHRPIEHDND